MSSNFLKMEQLLAYYDRQLEILRHAVGWPKNYRNHYVTGPGTTDYEDCEYLVSIGLMTKHHKEWVPNAIYVVTDAGREALGA
jgi:hypothetical protein